MSRDHSEPQYHVCSILQLAYIGPARVQLAFPLAHLTGASIGRYRSACLPHVPRAYDLAEQYPIDDAHQREVDLNR